MWNKISRAVREALAGSRKVKVVFRPDAAGDANYLLMMKGSGIISLSEKEKLLVMGVVMNGDFEGFPSRTVTVTLTDKFDLDWFVGRLFTSIEEVEVV